MWDEFSNSSIQNTSAAQAWTPVYVAVRWIQLVTASLSVLGSSYIIFSVTSQRLRTAPELYPLLWLSGSDLLLSVCWLVGASLFNTHCSHLSSIEQVLYMWSFLFTLNFVWNLFSSIRDAFTCCITGYTGQFSNRVSTIGKMTAVLSGLLPLLLMTPVFILSELRHCHDNCTQSYRCLLMDTGAMFVTSQPPQPIRTCRLLHIYCSSTFLCCFLITLTTIMGLLVGSRRLLRRAVSCAGYVGSQQRALLRDMDRRMVLYPAVFFCCWGPAVLLASLKLFLPSVAQGPTGAALLIAQALTAGSQGFLNCVVYGCSRSRVFHREAHTQTPLLRAQKHRGYHSLRTTG